MPGAALVTPPIFEFSCGERKFSDSIGSPPLPCCMRAAQARLRLILAMISCEWATSWRERSTCCCAHLMLSCTDSRSNSQLYAGCRWGNLSGEVSFLERIVLYGSIISRAAILGVAQP